MVIDTMIIAYALLHEKKLGDAALNVIEQTDSIIAPDMIRPEIANVIWQWTKWANLPLEDGLVILEDAELLIDEIVPSNHLWYHALELANENDHPVYDTLFVALARQRNTKVISNDQKLKSKFPMDVLLLDEC